MLSTLCHHRISTCYPQRGVPFGQHPGEKNSSAGYFSANSTWRQRSYTLPLGMAMRFRRMPKRKTVKSKKIAWEVLLFAKPFRNLCSRMRIPGSGINYRGLLNSMPPAPARLQADLDTCSLVLDFKECTRTRRVVQGGIWMVNLDRKPPLLHAATWFDIAGFRLDQRDIGGRFPRQSH